MAETTPRATTSTTLPKEVFNVEVTNHELLKLAYDSYLANSRQASATTLQRVKSAVVVRNHGNKKVLDELDSVHHVTQSGAVVVLSSAHAVTKTTPSACLQPASVSL